MVHETAFLAPVLAAHPFLPAQIVVWIDRVHLALADQNTRYSFLAYGTDSLAFAHLVLAIAFLGPMIDPVRNRWVLQFGVLACIGVLPLALIAGPLRGIPPLWRLIDGSFGIFGAIPLLICLRKVKALEHFSFGCNARPLSSWPFFPIKTALVCFFKCRLTGEML